MIINNKTIIIGNEERKNNNQLSNIRCCVNQIGYDVNYPKRATITNAVRGESFEIVKAADNLVVYAGIIYNQIADFSDFNEPGEYYLQYKGSKSYLFKIERNCTFLNNIHPAMLFMEQARGDDAMDPHNKSGIGWRDGHQFSFELNSLVMLYMSDPDYFESLPWDVYQADKCEYPELRVQHEPNIVWLMKFAVLRYYRWCVDKGVQQHAMIKGQLSYFLYIYPSIKKYVTSDFYTLIRDFTVQQWTVDTCNKSWFDETPHHNLLLRESRIGSIKGSNPPGYTIIPNLLMYEVCKRDNLDNQIYFDAAYKTTEWIIKSVDFERPENCKGQRMSEYITIISLTFFYEKYKDKCPQGLYEKIMQYAKIMISRSENLWDYRMWSCVGDLTKSTENVWVNKYPSNQGYANYVGNIASYAAICLSIIRVLQDKDLYIKKRLYQMAFANLDHLAGRNPMLRHVCFKAVTDIPGADRGWTHHLNGIANLEWCTGALDGSPKEESFPYNENANGGYSESWVAYNSAWNTSLAYLRAETSERPFGMLSR